MSFFLLSGIKIHGVAFDMDGTLIDCEPSNRMVVQKALGADFKINWAKYAGVKEVDILVAMKSEYGTDKITVASKNFLLACKQGYKDAIKTLQPRHGIMELLETLKELSVPIIIVTNSDTEMAKEKLKQCGMLNYMYDIIGSDTISQLGLKAKPSGDGYREAARRLGIKENEMLGFEDSTTGMNALSETNALAVHITDYGTQEHQSAHIVIDGMGSGDLLGLKNQIIRENYHKILGLPPEPGSPTYT